MGAMARLYSEPSKAIAAILATIATQLTWFTVCYNIYISQKNNIDTFVCWCGFRRPDLEAHLKAANVALYTCCSEVGV